jgi:hypothetical protein
MKTNLPQIGYPRKVEPRVLPEVSGGKLMTINNLQTIVFHVIAKIVFRPSLTV